MPSVPGIGSEFAISGSTVTLLTDCIIISFHQHKSLFATNKNEHVTHCLCLKKKKKLERKLTDEAVFRGRYALPSPSQAYAYII